jgi:hypothetical protein
MFDFLKQLGTPMTNAKTPEPAKTDVKDAAKANAEPTKSPADLSEAELNEVSGGINPQPLPPGMRI